MRALEDRVTASTVTTSSVTGQDPAPATAVETAVLPRVDVTHDLMLEYFTRALPEDSLRSFDRRVLPVLDGLAPFASDRQSWESTLGALNERLFTLGSETDLEAYRQAMEKAADRLLFLVMPGAAIAKKLANHPQLCENMARLVIGFFQGLGESRVISAETAKDYIKVIVAWSPAAPVYAILFQAGLFYQARKDLLDTVETVQEVYGNFDFYADLTDQIVELLPALGRFLETKEGGAALEELGRNAGLILGQTVKTDFAPKIDFTGDPLLKTAQTLARWAFTMGGYFGQLVLDLIVSLTGIGLGEVAFKVLFRGAEMSWDAFGWLKEWLLRFLRAFDSALVDKLERVAAELAGRIADRVARLAQSMADLTRQPVEAIEDGFASLEGILKTDRYRDVIGTLACDLGS